MICARTLALFTVLVTTFLCGPAGIIAQPGKRADTRDKRVMILAASDPIVIKGYLKGEVLPAVMELSLFPGELVSFEPTRQELKDALEAAQLMQEADKMMEKDPKRAIPLYEKARVKNPADPLLMMALGVAQFESGERDKAVQTLAKALAMASDGYREKARIKKNLDSVRAAKGR